MSGVSTKREKWEGRGAIPVSSVLLRSGEPWLYYYRARYYDPAVGRFLSEDPLGFGGGNPDFYGYVLNDPTGMTDPSGMDAAAAAASTAAAAARAARPALQLLQGGLAGGSGAAAGGAGGALVATVGLVALDVGLLGYDAYQAYQLGIAYGAWGKIPTPATETASTINQANRKARRQCEKRNKECPDCTRPVGTIVYDVDTDHFHFPFFGRHWHLLVMSQNPNNCQCFWQRVGSGNGTPPPNSQPKDPNNSW